MDHSSALHFTQRLLQNMNLSLNHFKDLSAFMDNSLQYIRDILNQNIQIKDYIKDLNNTFQANTIYRITDICFCTFLCFQLPHDGEPSYISIGPYRMSELTEQDYRKILNNSKQDPENLPTVKKILEDIPYIPDEQRILHIIDTLGEFLWGSDDNFTLKTLNNFSLEMFDPLIPIQNESKAFDPLNAMKLLEERYSLENQLIQAVSQGQTSKAEHLFTKMSYRTYERHSANPISDSKNYSIVLNTILRKAAELGAVHPYHIDSLANKFAAKIEAAASIGILTRLQSNMVHKYCLLVKKHSMHGYSQTIRKVLIQIDTNLTADLSLHTQASILNINSSYLSTLFKKEVGMTLTDYVNRKRIEHAIFLLNTTSMQIQAIAQNCGICDVNYFTKTFKKHVGKTPKEYRDSIIPYKRLSLTDL